MSISVVIPSAGLVELKRSLVALDICSVEVPILEVIIVVPNDHLFHFEAKTAESFRSNYFPVKFVGSQKKQQVYQRVLGFKEAVGDFILQLDDDMVLSPESLKELLFQLIDKGPNNVVGPVFVDIKSGQPIYNYNQNGPRKFLQNFIDVIIFGFPWGIRKLGKASILNRAYPIDRSVNSKICETVDWLAGGCVLGFKEDLILNDFYIFPGKAYSEDLLHSQLRRDKGIDHWQCSRASVMTDLPIEPPSCQSFREKLFFASAAIKREWLLSRELGANFVSRVRLLCFLVVQQAYTHICLFFK